MWRRSLRIEDHDDEAAAIAKVEAGIDVLGGDLAWTKPYVCHLLSLGDDHPDIAASDASTRRAETFRALKALTLRTAEHRPVVLMVEDLHWIDTASEEYLAFLAEAVPATRLLLVLTHRPGHRPPFGDRSYHRRITLAALEPHQMTAMVSAILDTSSLPDELAALIAGKAEGNPLFVEEVTKSLVEEGVLRHEGDRIELTRSLADVAVPDSIHGVLMARLDRLGEAPKHALQMASVIGREFALRLLARVTEAGDGVSSLVAELRALELIYEKAAHPELAYMFKHALTHDVAYESILHQRRRELHRTIGRGHRRALRRPPRRALRDAGPALRPGRGVGPRVRLPRPRGGEGARDLRERRRHLPLPRGLADRRDARGSVPDARRQALEEMLGAASFYTSAFADAADAYVRAAGHAPEVADRATNLVRAGESFTWAHRYDTAMSTLDEAVRIARAHGTPAIEALGLAQQAFQGVVMTGDLVRFGPVLERAIHTATEAGAAEALASAHSFLFETLEWRGRYREAITVAEQVIGEGRRLRLAHLVIWSEWFIGKASCCLGDYGRALSMLRESVDLCQRIGDRAWRTRMLNTTGWVLAELGAEDAALAANAAATKLAHEVGDPEIVANSEINLALNHVVAGRLDDAAAHLDGLRPQAGTPGDPWMRWRWSMHVDEAWGRLALARRDPATALAAAEAELVAARTFEARKLEARGELLRARALLALNRVDDAEGAIDAALAITTAIAYPAGRWRALHLRAEAARRRGRSAVALEAGHDLARVVGTLAASLPDDELRRALYRAAGVGHDARP